jgi:hypothetical protein
LVVDADAPLPPTPAPERFEPVAGPRQVAEADGRVELVEAQLANSTMGHVVAATRTNMLRDLERAKIVITNYHAFLRRETLERRT